MSTAPVYEEKYGFPTEYARLLFVCAAFTLGGLIVPMPMALRLTETAIFGLGGLMLAALGLRATRLVALRVDALGLTVGGSPLKYAATTEVVPWPQLRAIRLTRDSTPPHVTVVTADRKGKAGALSKPVKNWHLDVAQLGTTLRAVAPAVALTDRR
jgi:hypothetical protein